MIKFFSNLVEPGEAGDHSYQKTKYSKPWPCIQPLIKIYPTNNSYSNGKSNLDTYAAVGNNLPQDGLFMRCIH